MPRWLPERWRTDDLDWKEKLPPAMGLPQTDFPKNVAAMANSGGGLIVYGVTETQKAATGRADAGEYTEVYERSLRSAAITAISPPVLRLTVHPLGAAGLRAVVVEVPASVDGPHLIYKQDYFGAPVRTGSDTVWMKERQIEAMYRARFDERRHATEALDTLAREAVAGRDTDKRAWLVGVAHPRIPTVGERLSRGTAGHVISTAAELTFTYAPGRDVRPLGSVDRFNPRPGLRRWVAADTATGGKNRR
ncbi:ATP-binding protein [Frankia sp. Cas3]|uniref:AlbA family DNA-binding domain-containing protein n=1 Tax=Frankia sp. Cas3 TaxID=3073926 RepID=UPI002AD506A6|nr:ATP-binding protein [Frankia sp. Cas3]